MKRYVMLTNKKIYNGNEVVDAGEYKGKKVIHKDNKGYFLGHMEKQTDNLIDLLEVGDIVEIKDEREDIDFDYIPMITEFDIKQGKAMKSPFSFAVAIWKRNGDVMRRYEV